MAANYSTIEQALEELRAGHLIMVIDDPDRCLLYTSPSPRDA